MLENEFSGKLTRPADWAEEDEKDRKLLEAKLLPIFNEIQSMHERREAELSNLVPDSDLTTGEMVMAELDKQLHETAT
jgi:hypothetical protein